MRMPARSDWNRTWDSAFYGVSLEDPLREKRVNIFTLIFRGALIFAYSRKGAGLEKHRQIKQKLS